ncbi:MAG: hypothetical protein AAF599_16095 [Bacteroidota bacterium]
MKLAIGLHYIAYKAPINCFRRIEQLKIDIFMASMRLKQLMGAL